MPLKLVPPRKGKSPNYTLRGTHLRTKVDQTTGTSDARLARKELNRIKEEIERGRFSPSRELDFMTAAISYLEAGGEPRFIVPLKDHFGETPLSAIDQAAIDAAAVTIYPTESAATRNRQVYTPISAILKHAGREKALKRPKGSRGTPRTAWLRPEQAFALLAAARGRNARFGALCTFLLYTGCRLTEALRLEAADIDLAASFAYVKRTKNGEARAVNLPPVLVAELANIEFAFASAFGFSKAGRIYDLFDEVCSAAGVVIPPRVAFHIFRHSYGKWMREYGGLDTSGLVATRAWKSREAAAVYEHVETSVEAKKADLLPVPPRGKAVES
jgi:integrase